MYIIYTNDLIVVGPNKEKLDAVVADLNKSKLGVTVEGTFEELLVFNIDRKKYDSIHLTQPHLVEIIVKYLRQ